MTPKKGKSVSIGSTMRPRPAADCTYRHNDWDNVFCEPPCCEPDNDCDRCPYRHTCRKRKRVPYSPWRDPPYEPFSPTIWISEGPGPVQRITCMR